MATRNLHAPRPRISRTQVIATVFVVALYGYVGVKSSAEAEGLEKRQLVDVSRITCREFGQIPLAQALVLIGWVGGFYAGQKNETKVEVPDFVDKADRVVALCRENQTMRLMAAFEKELCREKARTHDRRPTAACR